MSALQRRARSGRTREAGGVVSFSPLSQEELAEQEPRLTKIPADEYHADPCAVPSLSSSIARILWDTTPAHARIAHPRLNPDYAPVDKSKFDLGTVAHQVLLEGDESVWTIQADDWRTKEAKDVRAVAKTEGKVALLQKDFDRVLAMVNVARREFDLMDDPQPFTHGDPEQMLVWQENGVTCRCLIDWLAHDRSVVDDYKTTAASADPAKWTRTMFGMGADIQVAFYLRGLAALGHDPVWRYVVQENYPPYALSVVTPSREIIDVGAAKVDHAIGLWRRCLAENRWPGYTRDVVELSLPPWETL